MTARYQTLDLELIENSRIRYRNVLLDMIVEVMRQRNHHQSLVQARSDRFGLSAHECDAVETFNEPWSQTSRITIMKCWIKSTYEPNEHALTLAQEMQSLSIQEDNLSCKKTMVRDATTQWPSWDLFR